jgi:uncharacterized protein (TIRG00374 family)
MKESLKYLVGGALAVLLLWLVLRGVDPAEMWHAVKQASVAGLLLSPVINLSHNVFRVWRWQALLAPVHPGVPFRPAFSAIIIGYATTWVIPGRIGEIVRPTLLSVKERVPLGPCLGSVVTDRVMDAGAIVLLFTIGTWLMPLPGEAAEHATAIRTASILMTLAAAGFLVLLVGISLFREPFSRWNDRRGKVIGWMGRLMLAIASGADAMRSPKLLARIVLHSLLAWLTIALSTWIGFMAAGANVPFPAVLVIMPMLALGVAVPTPGGAGSYHGAVKWGLMLFGVPLVTAVSASLLMHIVVTVPIILLGAVLVGVEGVSWRDMVRAARQFGHLGADENPGGERPVEETP